MRPTPRQLLERASSPAFLVSNLTNIRYVTGLTLSSGLLLVLPRSYALFVDSRYTEAAAQNAREGITLHPVESIEKFMQKLPICGFEEEDVQVGRLRRWKMRFTNTKFVRTSSPVEYFRRTKAEDELANLRRAKKITTELLRRVPAALRAHTTEKALAWKLTQWARELGADGLSFDPIVAFGSHTSRPHHQPTARTLQKGHIVQIDVGARYRGYCADMSEVFFSGKPLPAYVSAYKAVEEAKDAAMDAMKAGVTSALPDRIAKKILQRHNIDPQYCYGHALGHGVGLDVHEGPTLTSVRKGTTLLAGEVFAVEPAIYVPGKFGIRLEDMVVIE